MDHKLKARIAMLLILAESVLAPFVLCLLYAAFPLGGIGPVVIIKYIADLFLLSALTFWAVWTGWLSLQIGRSLSRVRLVLTVVGAIVLSLFLGIVTATLSVNLFIGLTDTFGIMDYLLS